MGGSFDTEEPEIVVESGTGIVVQMAGPYSVVEHLRQHLAALYLNNKTWLVPVLAVAVSIYCHSSLHSFGQVVLQFLVYNNSRPLLVG
jgi:hypothetical protein